MNKRNVAALLCALAMSLTCVGCATGAAAGSDSGGTSAEQGAVEQGAASEELVEFYVGTWRGSVKTEGNTVYGNVEGKEPMVELVLEEDGTATVTPLEGHEDLLGGEGTWSAADETAVTVTLDSATIEITVIDDATLECDPTAFGIEGFEVLTFEYY